MFHSFFLLPSKVHVLILLFAFFINFTLWSVSVFFFFFFPFFFIITRSCRLAVIRWSFVSLNPSVYISFSRTDSGFNIYNLLILLLIRVFHIRRKLMVFHWRLSDSKSPQVCRTLLSILAVFKNPLVWMVSFRPPTSKSSRPFYNPFVTVPKAPITIGIIVTFMFQSFFNSLARSRYLSRFSHSFSFILWSAGTAKSTILQIFFFFFFVVVDYYKI